MCAFCDRDSDVRMNVFAGFNPFQFHNDFLLLTFGAFALIKQLLSAPNPLPHCPPEGEAFDVDWKRVQKLHTGEAYLPGLRGFRQPFDPIHVERYNDAYPEAMMAAFPKGAQPKWRPKAKQAVQRLQAPQEEEY